MFKVHGSALALSTSILLTSISGCAGNQANASKQTPLTSSTETTYKITSSSISSTPIALTPLQEQFAERYGIVDQQEVVNLSDANAHSAIVKLSETVSSRYETNKPSDVYKIELSKIRYVDRPFHYSMRSIALTIARGDSVLVPIKDNNFLNSGIETQARITLAENMRLYLNGKYVNTLYRNGVFPAYSANNNSTISGVFKVLNE